MFDKYGKKKIYATGIIASIVAVLVFVIFALPHENSLSLKKETFIVEYGKTISTKAVDYLKTEDTKILDKAKVTIEKIENEKDKDYAKIGTYKAIIKYGEKSENFKIEVKDTKAPVFKDIMKEVVIEKNAENVDYTKYFQVEDLSDTKIKVDSKKVDLGKVGDYEIKVNATDKYKNAKIKNVKVKVVSLEDAKKENGITKALDGTIYQSKALKEKNAEEQKVEDEKKQQEVANNTGGTSSSGSNTNNGGGNTSNGGSQPTKPAPAPAPQPNGIGAVIATAQSFVGRTDMTCNDLVVQAYKQNNYDTPYDNARAMGYSVGADSSVLQAGDLLAITNHVMLVVSVSGGHITTIEGGRGGTNVLVTHHVVQGATIWMDGVGQNTILEIRRM
ncbi:MAG: hypothetical protein RR673_07490 [Erysipelotrichaceae bacterium]